MKQIIKLFSDQFSYMMILCSHDCARVGMLESLCEAAVQAWYLVLSMILVSRNS